VLEHLVEHLKSNVPEFHISSVKKDWEHCVSLQGGLEANAADASRIGGLIGVKYT